jgi:hypothetical protein
MKKAIVLIALTLMVLSCFSACTGEGYPVSADGNRIPAGVYAYYLAEMKDADSTVEFCRSAAAAERLMKDEGITLSANYKRIIADETDSKWSLFSSYYESIGVSKQDITQALTAIYNKKELIDYYYGENGKTPVSDDKIKSQLDKTYVGFKAIEASYMKISDMGESVSLSEAERKNLRSRFESMAKSINSGAMTINEANEAYNESIGIIVTQNPETALIKRGDVLYGDSFFDDIAKLKKGQAAVVESGSSVFLLQRQVITNDDDGFVFVYRSEILESLKMKDLEKKIEDLAESLEVKINKRLCEEIEEKVL